MSQRKWDEMWADPTCIKDTKDGHRRVLAALDDHVQFVNKWAQRKKVIRFGQAKKSLTDEELASLQNRIAAGHDVTFAGGP